MKKWMALLLVFVMCVGLCACGEVPDANETTQQTDMQSAETEPSETLPAETEASVTPTDETEAAQTETTEADPFENAGLSDEAREEYYYWEEVYSPEEYVALVKKLVAALNDESIVPVCDLSDELLFVKRTVDTYDRYEESIAIVNDEGTIVSDWNAEWGVYDIQYRAECGDYFFIITKGYSYNYYDCDVVTKDGKIVANIYCKANRYDIGEGYVFFSLGADFGYIMNPDGEIVELQTASVMPSYCEKAAGALEENDRIGRISEGLFYGYSKGNMNTVAYYYNTAGEVVIDLSTRAVNFEVTQLSDFSDGQARIEFIGANGKLYYAYIDKKGSFIGEPTEIEESSGTEEIPYVW